MKAIIEWIKKGLLKCKFHIVHGLDAAPSALSLLYNGGNTGKLCVVFFVFGELVSYLTLPGSLRFPSTKLQRGSKLCDCLHAVVFLLISLVLAYHSMFIIVSFYVRYNIRISGLPPAWHPVCVIRVYLQPDLPQYHKNCPSTWTNANRFHGEDSGRSVKYNIRLSCEESVGENREIQDIKHQASTFVGCTISREAGSMVIPSAR